MGGSMMCSSGEQHGLRLTRGPDRAQLIYRQPHQEPGTSADLWLSWSTWSKSCQPIPTSTSATSNP